MTDRGDYMRADKWEGQKYGNWDSASGTGSREARGEVSHILEGGTGDPGPLLTLVLCFLPSFPILGSCIHNFEAAYLMAAQEL